MDIDALAARVGDHLGTSEWLEVGQDRIDLFAEATGDHQWIHRAGPEADAGPQTQVQLAAGVVLGSAQPVMVKPVIVIMLPLQLAERPLRVLLRFHFPVGSLGFECQDIVYPFPAHRESHGGIKGIRCALLPGGAYGDVARPLFRRSLFLNRLRRRFLATMVSPVAPQTPACAPSPNGSIRHGPIVQLRQQMPRLPKPHCGSWDSSLSQAICTPESHARSIISVEAGSTDRCFPLPMKRLLPSQPLERPARASR